jgi:type II secretory ATPase GspE/PulE/Tfp pilus assembly ATPase PilB-like protein
MREMQSELMQKSRTTPAVMLVASMIKAAAERRASDIHIEPHSDDTAIRFRADGMLREYQRIPKVVQNSVAACSACRTKRPVANQFATSLLRASARSPKLSPMQSRGNPGNGNPPWIYLLPCTPLFCRRRIMNF